MHTILEQGLRELGIAQTVRGQQETRGALLEQFAGAIEQFNDVYGLVSLKNFEALLIRHILDSLSPLAVIAGLPALSIADIGSGAGLPGIPLSICLPDRQWTLIERSGKRAGFLQHSVALLRLENVRVVQGQMEEQRAEHFDLLVFRALHPFSPALLKALFRLLVPGGIIAAYKGRAETIASEMAGLAVLWEALPVKTPFLDEERHLVLIRKDACLK
ncbi:MAG: 16S rRNA (guanine(527)-N(7))-methyltransferase RsmG [Spirochaetaceae bacterium]|jgi:16S rRNA (guanine527-N7)-methyltransferase|nr:16S rRNA (guanine(527)-N(7))-methyltransferase RsmG [Spirochaetaceae bacterium]